MSTELLPCPFCGWPAECNAGGLDIYCSNQYGCLAFDCSMSADDWNRRFLCNDHQFCCNTCNHKCEIELVEENEG